VQEITVQELEAWQKAQHDFKLLDVREEHEREAFHIGGDWLPMAEVIRHHEKISKEKPVVIYCRKGVRSAIVIQRLEDKYGFTNLFNLVGGMSAWQILKKQDQLSDEP
jgi:adenylyltransferase/sulfurtransferase